MKVWVTRDKYRPFYCYMWTVNQVGARAVLGFHVMTHTPERFRRFFGFTPKMSSCDQYELTLEKIE